MGSRTISTYMSKRDETLWPPPIGPRKAARLVAEARRRAGLSQTEVAHRAGVPINTVHRIERGRVDPRLGTIERILGTCGRTLVSEHRSNVDRSEIARLLDSPPLTRLGRAGLVRALQYLAGQGVSFVIVGETAERLHGSPVPARQLEINTLGDEANRKRLARALEACRKPLVRRVSISPVICSPERFDLLVGPAWSIPLPAGRLVQVAALEDLIAAASGFRAELLRGVREEHDSRPA